MQQDGFLAFCPITLGSQRSSGVTFVTRPSKRV